MDDGSNPPNDSQPPPGPLERLAEDFEKSAQSCTEPGKACATKEQQAAAFHRAALLLRAEISRRANRARYVGIFLCFLAAILAGRLIYQQWRASEPDYSRTLSVEVSSPGHRYVEVFWNDPDKFPDARTVLTQTPAARQDWKVKIELLAAKNPRSAGTVTTLTGIFTPEQHVDLSDPKIQAGAWAFAKDPWAASGQSLSAVPDGTPRSISAELSGGRLTIEFWESPFGGKLRVEANGLLHYVDTYSVGYALGQFRLLPTVPAGRDFVQHSAIVKLGPQNWDRLTFKTEGDTVPEIRHAFIDGEELQSAGPGTYRLPKRLQKVRRAATIAGFTAGITVLMAGLLVVRLWTNRKRSKWVTFSLPLVLSIGSALLWTAIFNPGNVDIDSWNQWLQGLWNNYHTWYPPLMAMLMHGVQTFGGSMTTYAFIQSVFLWLPIFLILRDTLASNRAWIIGCALFLLNPALWTYSVTVMKDVGTAATGLWSIWFFLRYFRSRRPWDFWSAVWCCSLMVAFRVNSLLIVMVPLAIVLLEKHRGILWKAAKCLAVLILCLTPDWLAKNSPVVHGKASFFGPLFMSSYTGIVSKLPADGAEFRSEQERFDRIFGEGKLSEYIAIYDPRIIVGILTPLGGKLPPVPVRKLEEERRFILTRTALLALRHPALFLTHKLTNAQVLFQYPQPSTGAFARGVVENDLGIIANSRFPAWRQRIIEFGVWCTQHTLIFHHYVAQILALIAVPFLLWFRTYSGIFIVANGLIYTLSLVIPDMFGEWRYLFFSYLCNLLCIVLALECCIRAVKRRFRRAALPVSENDSLPALQPGS